MPKIPLNLFSTFGSDRNSAKRTLTPSEAATELAILIGQGYKVSEIAKQLNVSTRVIGDLIQIAKIEQPIRDQYLSKLWKPLTGSKKLKNEMSFSAMGEFAKMINDNDETKSISEGLALASRYSFSKTDMRDACHIRKVRDIESLSETIQQVEDEKGTYGDKPKVNSVQTFIAICGKAPLSENQLIKIKTRVESLVGKIVDRVVQIKSLIHVTLIANKVSEKTLETLMTADDVQDIVTAVRKEND